MIIKTFCNTCGSAFDIMVSPLEVTLVRDVMDKNSQALCPRMCGGKVLLDPSVDLTPMTGILKAPVTLTGREFYKAVHGAGMPDEIPKSVETTEALLLSKRVVGVDAEQRNERIYITKLKLEGGLVMYLTAGVFGAVVTKITKEK